MRKLEKSNYLTGHFLPHESNSPVLRVVGLGYRYGNRWALEDISFELGAGERIAVVGPNGAGKSTLFKLIAGVINPVAGKIDIYGHEPGCHICIAYVHTFIPGIVTIMKNIITKVISPNHHSVTEGNFWESFFRLLRKHFPLCCFCEQAMIFEGAVPF